MRLSRNSTRTTPHSRATLTPRLASTLLCGLPLYFFLCLTLPTGWCAEPAPNTQQAAANDSATLRDHIDQRFTELWRSHHVQPASQAADLILLRRASLDLLGRIPTEWEVREFLASPSANRYEQAIAEMLGSIEFHQHIATVLRNWWLPQLETQQFAHLRQPYERWLAQELRRGTSFGELVSLQLTAPIGHQPVSLEANQPGIGSPVFLAACELLPERIAANVSRAFLGLNIDCAQCHEHPHSRWTQGDFWKTAAWFNREEIANSANGQPSIQLPDSNERVQAAFLFSNDSPPRDTPALSTSDASYDSSADRFQFQRDKFTDWLVADDNLFFTRNAVNGIWAALFARGLVEPRDDLTQAEFSPTGEILNDLAGTIATNQFSIDVLYAAIVTSQPYRIRSYHAPPSSDRAELRVQLFAEREPRMLSGEQFVKSLETASPNFAPLGSRDHWHSAASQFLVKDPTSFGRSTLQSLLTLNGPVVLRACNPHESSYITSLSTADYLSVAERTDSLFLRTLGRLPGKDERIPFDHLLANSLSNRDQHAQQIGSLLWVLINSAEFNTLQ